MVKILSNKKAGKKLPVLRIVQVVVFGVLCVYAGFVLKGPQKTNSNVLKESGGKTQVVSTTESRERGASTGTVPTIAYAVSVTACGSDPLEEGAAVLKHSIHLTSIHGNQGGRYDYKMYAIYHPEAASCVQLLGDLGYELLERQTPIKVSDIEGEFLRSKIESNGCCGEKELIKLEAYTLTDHPVVVHLDLDVLILKPLDDLFDAMLYGTGKEKIQVQWPQKPFPNNVNAYLTRDCEFIILMLH